MASPGGQEDSGEFAGGEEGGGGDDGGHDDLVVGAPRASFGDVDGDGVTDLLLAANGLDSSGEAYLVSGSTTGAHEVGDVVLAHIASGDTYTQLGLQRTTSSAGDVDGDGFLDLILGQPLSSVGGTAYLFLGPTTGELDLSDADRSWDGPHAWSIFGHAVAGVGDDDQDGYDDVLVGAPYAGGIEDVVGALFLMPGASSPPESLDVASAAIWGTEPKGSLGGAFARLDDATHDGRADYLVGNGRAYNAGGSMSFSSEPQLSFLFAGPLSGTLGPDDAVVTFEDGAYASGNVVAGVGDLDSDGREDIAITDVSYDENTPGNIHLFFLPGP